MSIQAGRTGTGTMIFLTLRSALTITRGCVTPKQIANLIESSGGDTDLVDGYDELPAEFQAKINFALKNGHIPDEDWKGVSDL